MSEKNGLTRRAFVASVAAGAAVIASGGSARAATRTTKRRGGGSAPSAAVRAEIAKQKKYTADTLATIRQYPLPAGGGEIGFLFRPLAPKREGGDK